MLGCELAGSESLLSVGLSSSGVWLRCYHDLTTTRDDLRKLELMNGWLISSVTE